MDGEDKGMNAAQQPTRQRSGEEAVEADLAELRRTQGELRATRNRYAKLYNLAPVWHFILDRQGKILEVNETGARMLATTQEDVVGRPFSDFIASGGQDAYHLFRRKLFAGDGSEQCDLEMVHGDGFHARLYGRHMEGYDDEEDKAFLVVIDVSEQRQAHEQLERRSRELATLNEFARSAGSTLDLTEIFTSLEEMLRDRFDLPGGCVFSYVSASDSAQLRHYWGLPEAIADACSSLSVNGTHLETAVRKQEAVQTSDFGEISMFAEKGLADARPNFGEHLTLPLLGDGKVNGILCLFCRDTDTFSESRIDFLSTLGHQVGSAIQAASLFAEVRAGQEQLRYLTQAIVSAQEEERHRVSRDLHDEAGQVLTALKFHLEMIEEELGSRNGEDEVQQQLVTARALSEDAMNRLRKMAHNLRPAALDDMGLIPALEGLCNDFSRQLKGSIGFREEGELPPVSDEAKIVLYRFVQEALTNAVKHSQASEVRVTVSSDDGTVCTEVKDDGVGFDRAETMEGIGLLSMRERLESVGGELKIESIVGNGTCLTACLPTLDA